MENKNDDHENERRDKVKTKESVWVFHVSKYPQNVKKLFKIVLIFLYFG